jgi:hypothetical protein
MSKRYYYTDAIVALYMMKEFGVEFYVDRSDGISGLNSYNMRTADKTKVSLEEYFKENNNDIFLIIEDSQDLAFTVTKESEHIFEPRNYDLAGFTRDDGISTIAQYDEAKKAFINGSFRILKKYNPKIIMRDNKQFFYPEVEND